MGVSVLLLCQNRVFVWLPFTNHLNAYPHKHVSHTNRHPTHTHTHASLVLTWRHSKPRAVCDGGRAGTALFLRQGPGNGWGEGHATSRIFVPTFQRFFFFFFFPGTLLLEHLRQPREKADPAFEQKDGLKKKQDGHGIRPYQEPQKNRGCLQRHAQVYQNF